MEIKTIVVGPLQTNCYILTKNNQTLIIDPGDEPNKIINEINIFVKTIKDSKNTIFLILFLIYNPYKY